MLALIQNPRANPPHKKSKETILNLSQYFQYHVERICAH